MLKDMMCKCRFFRCLMFLFVTLVGIVFLQAETFQKDGLTYKINSEGAKVTLVKCESSLRHIFIPDSVSYRGNRYCVASLGYFAFSNIDTLETIDVSAENPFFTIQDGVLFNKAKTELLRYPSGLENYTYVVPSTVRTIGRKAFEKSSIKAIVLSSGLTHINDFAFTRCRYLKSIVFGKSLKVIGRAAFSGCSSLVSLELPEGVDSIYRSAFLNCSALKSLRIPSTVSYMPLFISASSLKEFRVAKGNKHFSSVDGVLFNKDKTVLLKYPAGKSDSVYRIPSTVEEIGMFAFDGVLPLVKVILSQNMQKINDDAFNNCRSLQIIEFSKNLKILSRQSFSGCLALNTLVWAEGFSSLNSTQIEKFSGIKSIFIPRSLKRISRDFFESYYSLSDIHVAVDNLHYASVNGVLFNQDLTELIKYPMEKADSTYILPSTVKKIAPKAFSGASNLKSIVLSDSLDTIGRNAFEDCDSLYSMSIQKDFIWERSNLLSNSISLNLRTIKFGKNADVTKILSDLFDCSISEYIISEENPEYSSEGGVIFNKDKTLLIRYPCALADSVYTVPSTVKEIAPEAFQDAKELTSILLPQKLKKIDCSAFRGCSSLKKIEFPSGIRITNRRPLPPIIR